MRAVFVGHLTGSTNSLKRELKERNRGRGKKKITRIMTHAWHHGLRTVIVHSLAPSWNSEGKSGLKWVTSGVELQPVLSDLCRALRRRCKVIKPTGTVVCYFDDTRSILCAHRKVEVFFFFFWREEGGLKLLEILRLFEIMDY